MKKFIIIGLAIIGLYVLSLICLGSNSEHFIQITYFDNNNEKTEFATKILNQNNNCITFISLYGLKQTVCSQNIVVTNYK